MDWMKLEALSLKSERLASMGLALFDAMYEGPNDASNFEGAMDLLTTLLNEYSKDMNTFFKEVHATRKDGAA